MPPNLETKRPGDLARQWWRGLQPAPDRGRPGDRAALARLRRADVGSAMMDEAALGLFRIFGWRSPSRLPRIATLACVLAHVRTDIENSFGSAIGRDSIDDKDSAVLSVVRFQRLLNADTEEEIERGFRRAVALLGGEANVADLARIILFFDDEETRRRLAFDYFAAGVAAPSSSDPGNAASA